MLGRLRCVVLRSSKSREDFEDYAPYVLPEENEVDEKPKHHSKKSSFFGLFRSSSDPDFHANSRTRRSFSWRKKSNDKKQQPETNEVDNSLPVNGVDPHPVNGVGSWVDSLPVKTLPVDSHLEDPLDPLDTLQDDTYKAALDLISADPLSIDSNPVDLLPGYSLPVEDPLTFNSLLVDNLLPVDPLPPDDPSWKKAKAMWEKNETEETKEGKEKKHKKDKKKHRSRSESKEDRRERKREKEEKKRIKSESRERSKTRSKERDSSRHKDRDRSESKHRSKERTKRDGDSRERHRRKTDSEASNDSKRGGHKSRKHKHKHDKNEKDTKHNKVKKEYLHELDKLDLSDDEAKQVMDKLDGVERLKRRTSRDRSRDGDNNSRDGKDRSRERGDLSREQGDESHDHHHHHHHRSRRSRDRRRRSNSKEKHVSIDSEDSHYSHCASCQRSLKDFEARQEQCSAEIDTARRSIEHKIQRLEKKFDQQFSSTEKQLDIKNDSSLSDKDRYQSVVSQLSGEFREVTRKLEVRTDQMKSELTRLDGSAEDMITGSAHAPQENRDKSARRMHRKAVGFREVRCPRLAKSSPILWPSSHSRTKGCEADIEDDKDQIQGATIRVSQSNALDTLNRNGTVVKGADGSSSELSSEDQHDRDQDLAEDLFDKSFDENTLEGLDEGTLSDESSEALQMKYRRQIRDMERRCRERSQTEQETLRKRIGELEVLLEAARIKKRP